MATTQQIKMLLARAAGAGVKADWADFADMQNGEIDDKLAEYEGLKKGAEHAADFGETRQKPSLNSYRFGMCCKLVVKHRSFEWCIQERGKFASDVLSLYQSVTYAEKVVAEKAAANGAAVHA